MVTDGIDAVEERAADFSPLPFSFWGALRHGWAMRFHLAQSYDLVIVTLSRTTGFLGRSMPSRATLLIFSTMS